MFTLFTRLQPARQQYDIKLCYYIFIYSYLKDISQKKIVYLLTQKLKSKIYIQILKLYRVTGSWCEIKQDIIKAIT